MEWKPGLTEKGGFEDVTSEEAGGLFLSGSMRVLCKLYKASRRVLYRSIRGPISELCLGVSLRFRCGVWVIGLGFY